MTDRRGVLIIYQDEGRYIIDDYRLSLEELSEIHKTYKKNHLPPNQRMILGKNDPKIKGEVE